MPSILLIVIAVLLDDVQSVQTTSVPCHMIVSGAWSESGLQGSFVSREAPAKEKRNEHLIFNNLL